MTDFELTLLCAESMGWTFINAGNIPSGWRAAHFEKDGFITQWEYSWKPLHDDAQAMALVKKFRMFVNGNADEYWRVAPQDRGVTDCDGNLNRAICECVAKMQQAKAREAA